MALCGGGTLLNLGLTIKETKGHARVNSRCCHVVLLQVTFHLKRFK